MSQIPRRRPSKARDTARLDGVAWIEAALQVLAARGIDGVRIEVLSKRLGVTKGSFYWHFKDRDALYDAMLQEWRRVATIAIIQRLEATREPPLERLQRLLRVQFDTRRAQFGADMELSMRLWGRHDRRVAEVLRKIDDLRLRYIEKLLIEIGATRNESKARAVLIYSYMRVSRSLAARPADDELIRSCEHFLIGKTRKVTRARLASRAGTRSMNASEHTPADRLT